MKKFIVCPIVTYEAITETACKEFTRVTAAEKKLLLRVLYDLLGDAVCFPDTLTWCIVSEVQKRAEVRDASWKVDNTGKDPEVYYLDKMRVAIYALSCDWKNLANVEFPICVDRNLHKEMRAERQEVVPTYAELPKSARHAYWESIRYNYVWKGSYLEARIGLLHHMINKLKLL